jgi:Na+-driven multidrug efflux pump
VLDALAIAAQVMVGRMLGAGDARGRARRGGAHDRLVGRARRGCSGTRCSRWATDPAPVHPTTAVVAQAHEIWWLFAALMPLNGAVFALDGILIGAGDTRFMMWAMLAASAVYIPIALVALDQAGGSRRLVRPRGADRHALATCGGRFASERWVLTGALP